MLHSTVVSRYRVAARALAAVSIAAGIGGCVTQTAADGWNSNSYFQSAENLKALESVAQRFDKGLGIACDAPYTIKRMIVADVDMNLLRAARFKTESGQSVYAQRFHAERCGNSKLLNAIVSKVPGKDPVVSLSVPGETLADPVLVRDILPKASILALVSGLDGKCQPNGLLDTAVDGGMPAKPPAAWREYWTFKSCEKTARIEVDFTNKGAAGTSYNMRIAGK